MSYQITVFDVGKTNKKLFVYDSDLRCLNPDDKGVVFDLVTIDGVLCDDMASIRAWMLDRLRDAARRFRDVRAVSITAHGATIALLGRARDRVFPGDGGLVFPIVSYTQGLTPEEDEAFYRDLGMSPEEMQRRTATARFGWLVNYGRQVHWLKRRFPSRFAEVTGVLMLPQYLGCLLTGEKGVEPTYMGCHGYLLDAGGTKYSAVAERLGVADKLPALPLRSTWATLGAITPQVAAATGLSPGCLVTMGAHDSNAALVPYFVKGFRDFVVQDTGTWVVTMSPCREAVFAEEEIGKEVFFNRSVYGEPVKTAIFRGGAEFEFYSRKVLPSLVRPAGLNVPLLAEILRCREAFALPNVDRGTGIFPKSVPRLVGLDTIFRDAESAWTVVDLGLALEGAAAIRMAGGPAPRQILIQGPFAENAVYAGVISTLFPAARVSLGASNAAFGAAMMGVAAVEGVRPDALASRFQLDLPEIPKLDLPQDSLRAYAADFLAQVS